MNFAQRPPPRGPGGAARSQIVDPRTLGAGDRFWINQRGVGPREALKLRSEQIGTVALVPSQEGAEGAFLVGTTVGNVIWVAKSVVAHDQEARTLPFWSWPKERQEFGFEEAETIEVGDAEAATPSLARMQLIETVPTPPALSLIHISEPTRPY